MRYYLVMIFIFVVLGIRCSQLEDKRIIMKIKGERLNEPRKEINSKETEKLLKVSL